MPSLQGQKASGLSNSGLRAWAYFAFCCLFHAQELVGHRPWRVCVGDLGRNGLREFVKGADLVVEGGACLQEG